MNFFSKLKNKTKKMIKKIVIKMNDKYIKTIEWRNLNIFWRNSI